MNLGHLQTRLQQALDGGRLQLDRALLEEAGWGDLFAEGLGQPELSLTHCRLTPNGSGLSLRGEAGLLNVEAMAVEARFFEADGALCVVMTATPPNGWTFDKSFPELPVSADFALDVCRDYQSHLSKLPFADARFVLASDAGTDQQLGITFARGLNFAASLAVLAGPLSHIAALTENIPSVRVSGIVNDLSAQPVIRLKAPIPIGLKVGSASVQGSELRILSSLSRFVPDPVSRIELGGTIALGTARVQLAAVIPLSADARSIDLAGRFENVALPGLGDVAAFVGIPDLAEVLPPALRDSSGIQLTDVAAGFALSGPSVSYLVCGIEIPDLWTIVPNLFTVQKAKLTWLIANPTDAASREIHGMLEGEMQIADVALRIAADLPSLAIGGALAARNGVDLRGLVAHFVPAAGNLPPLALADLTIALGPKEQEFSLQGRFTGDWPVPTGTGTPLAMREVALSLERPPGADQPIVATASGVIDIAGNLIDVSATLAAALAFDLRAEHVPLTELARALLGAAADALPPTVLHDARMALAETGDFTMSARVDADIASLAARLGIPLPEGFPAVSFSKVALRFNAGEGSWRVEFICVEQFSFAAGSTQGISLKQPLIAITGGTNVVVESSFVLDGQVALGDGAALACRSLRADWASGGAPWSFGGDVEATLLGATCALAAAIEKSGEATTFQLTYEGAVDLCNWAGVGRAQLEALTFVLGTERQDQGVEGSSAGYAFAVSGDVSIAIDHLFETTGHLAVETSDGARKLLVAAEAPKIAPIALPAGVLHIEAERLLLAHAKEGREDKASWTLGGAAGVWFTDIPTVVQAYFPAERIDGSLLIGARGTELTCTLPDELQPDFPPLAFTFANDYRLELGLPQVKVENLRVALGNDRKELGADLHVTVPPELNYLLGWDNTGKPNQVFLNESFGLRLALSKHPTLTLRSSPLKDLDLYEKDGKTWSDWAFGSFAKFSFQTPEFSYVDGRWQGSAAFERHGPLKLPLMPIKFMLEQIGLGKEIVASLPDAMELQEIDLADDDFGSKLKRALGAGKEAKLDPALSNALTQVIGLIEKGIDRLPLDFQDYLTVKLPESLSVEIAVGGGGATTFAVATKDSEPLKVLVPAISALGPALYGFCLRKLSVGQVMGGSLAVLEVDGHIDMFDLPTLVGALALPDNTGRDLRNRITCKDALLVVPTGLPIPIPLFYRELAWDLKSVVGLELATHWSYPKPAPSIFGFVALFGKLIDFFTKPDYLLHQQTPPAGMALEFTVGRNAIALPPYLGGLELGLKEPLPALDIYQSTARLLDALKTGNASYLIQAIPLRYEEQWIRIGQHELRFGPLFLEAAWCITTEQEFRDQVLGNPEAMKLLEHTGGEEILASLPEAQGPGLDQGFIVLLAAGAGLDSVLSGRTQFGIALTRDGGFETGFQWIVSAADLLDLVIGGRLKADEHGVEIEGNCQLLFDHRNLIRANGKIHVKDTYILVGLGFNLSEQLKLEGDLRIEAKGITFEGRIDWSYGKGLAVRGVTASARIDKEGMAVAFKAEIFGSPCDVGAQLGGEAKTPRGFLEFEVSPALQEGFAGSFAGLGQEIGQEIDRLTGEITAGAAEVEQLAFDLEGLKNAIASQLETTASSITKTAQQGASKGIDSWINRNVTTNLGIRSAAKRWANANIKPVVNREIASRLHGHVSNMKREAAVLRAATPKEGKQLILGGLNYLLENYQSFDYRYKETFSRRIVVTTIKIPVDYTYKYRMPKTLVSTIKKGIKAVATLSEGQKIVLQKETLQKFESERKKMLELIAEDVEKEVRGGIPQVEHISVETGLGLISPNQAKIAVVLLHNGRPREYEIAAELTDLLGCAKEAMKLLASELASA